MSSHLRIARPVSDLMTAADMYRQGLGLSIIGRFANHEGFDGIMLGDVGGSYHLEFTQYRNHAVAPSPTQEDLLVLYIEDASAWQQRCNDMSAAGFKQVASFNPYWELRGRTYEDRDGYRVVLQNDAWSSVESTSNDDRSP